MGITALQLLTSQVLRIQELLNRGTWSVTQSPSSIAAHLQDILLVKQVIAELRGSPFVESEFVIIPFC